MKLVQVSNFGENEEYTLMFEKQGKVEASIFELLKKKKVKA